MRLIPKISVKLVFISYKDEEMMNNSAFHDEEWILHASTQDLPCLSELGLKPKLLFDTENTKFKLGESSLFLINNRELYMILSGPAIGPCLVCLSDNIIFHW